MQNIWFIRDNNLIFDARVVAAVIGNDSNCTLSAFPLFDCKYPISSQGAADLYVSYAHTHT